MYGLTLDATYLALHTRRIPDVANFTLEKLCPYMTQPIEVRLYPDGAQIPVVSWQMARQFEQNKQNHPELGAFRLLPLKREEGWPVPRLIDGFDGLTPGRLLLLTANMRRGLGDMVLLMPIFRAQAQRLKQLGWPQKLSISSSNDFSALFYGQSFLDTFLPECPGLYQVMAFDYTIEYGLNLARMQHFIGIRDWHEIDLEVKLYVPQERIARWDALLPEQPRVFVNWASFDAKRSLSASIFASIKQAYPDFAYFTSLHKNPQPGEIFPGGPVNLWPQQTDLLDLLALLANMDVVITTNTGIAHVAAGLGKPTLVIFSGRLYGWDNYWPDLHSYLYPTMHPIGLQEKLGLTEHEIEQQILAKLEQVWEERGHAVEV